MKNTEYTLKEFLDRKADEYENPEFIPLDPISIPHRFSNPRDIEIAGFFAAIFSWGNRTTIIAKSSELMQRMDNDPHAFVTQHTDADLKSLLGFKHRTFNDTDLLYFVHFLNHHYQSHSSLESAFTGLLAPNASPTQKKPNTQYPTPHSTIHIPLSTFHHPHSTDHNPLSTFHHPHSPYSISLTLFEQYFFSLPDYPERTRKHISTPAKNSACKRLNMYLRWMVRSPEKGVDFGIWKSISPAELICPTDVHVLRVARRLQVIQRQQNDWTTALELTTYLRSLDEKDPVKYDFALFGLGVIEKF